MTWPMTRHCRCRFGWPRQRRVRARAWTPPTQRRPAAVALASTPDLWGPFGAETARRWSWSCGISWLEGMADPLCAILFHQCCASRLRRAECVEPSLNRMRARMSRPYLGRRVASLRDGMPCFRGMRFILDRPARLSLAVLQGGLTRGTLPQTTFSNLRF